MNDRMKTAMALSGLAAASAAALLSLPHVAWAQSAGSTGMATYQSGYGGSRYSTAQAQSGSTRDANGNRLVVNGLIQQGASSYSSQSGGVANAFSGVGGAGQGTTIGGSTAIGNNLNVVVQGNHNTVIVNSRQTNNGAVNAGTNLNETPGRP